MAGGQAAIALLALVPAMLAAAPAQAQGWSLQQPAPAPQPVPAAAPTPPPNPAPPPAPIQTPVLVVSAASHPTPGPADAPSGGSAFRPQLPPGTPPEQAARDPALPVVDLVAAIERAYWTNPQLLADRARARSADYRIPEVRGQYGPQLEYSASYGTQRDNFEVISGLWRVQSGWTSAVSAVLRQPLFTFGRLRASEDNARAGAAYAEASLRATEQQVLLGAINAYASVLRDRIGVSVAADNVALLARQSNDTETRLAAHESTATDAQQVASRRDLASAQLLVARSTAAASEAAFLRFVGAPAGDLAPPNPFAIPVRSLEEAYAFAADHNPVIAAAHARERASRAQLAAARAELLPRVDLTGSASYGTQSPYNAGLHQTELRAAITLSGVIDAGPRTARISEAQEANDADWRIIDETLRENRAELASAWNEWQAQDAAIQRLAAAVAAARSAYDGALEQERAGMRTTLDILELARDLLTARSSYNETSAAAYVAQARVLAAMGALDRASLLPDARGAYDPAAHLARAYWQADIPLVTPLLRALDGVTSGPRRLRPVRDPAAPLGLGAVRPQP
ncbi:TolC family protein [Novosphingobium bradum]|uniref:TolC family protein n=1 Tax=Novosphingobium bradum TaxID=1737444 RepID=A0ABV7IQR2_9SPHN